MKRKIVKALLFPLLLVITFSGVSCGSGVENNHLTTDLSETKGPSLEEGDISKAQLSNYKIVFAASIDEENLSRVIALKGQLESIFGITMSLSSDAFPASQSAEILIGDTNRLQSDSAATVIGNYGYAVGFFDQDIVIKGSAPYFLKEAIQYFSDTCVVPASETGVLSVPKNACVVKPKICTLAADGKSRYGIVNSGIMEDSAKNLTEKIKSLTGATISNSTKLKPTAMAYELLVGDTDRPESAEALNRIQYDEAIIAMIHQKVVIRGWNEDTTFAAIKTFTLLLEQMNIGKEVFIPMDFSFVFSVATPCKLDIPEFSGGKVSAAENVGQDNFLICIEETTAEMYRNYCSLLEKSGYSLYSENEDSNNFYATYVSSQIMIHVYYVSCEGIVRIVTAPMSSTCLPPKEQEKTEKVTDTSVTQMILNYYDSALRDDGNFGNCYIVTLEDGSLLVYDGGASYSEADVTRLWNLMNELGTRKDGKIVIAGWIITHEHVDHYYGMYRTLVKYGSEIRLEKIYCNSMSDSMCLYTPGATHFIGTAKYDEAYRVAGGFELVRVHTGQVFWVRNVKVEVLFTPEDIYPTYIGDFTDFNDSSVVTRMTADGHSFLMLGDSYWIGSNILCNRYGENLQSDICQVSHHGWWGATKSVYDLASPALLMWPHSQIWYNRFIQNDPTTVAKQNNYRVRFCEVDQYLVEKFGEDRILLADHCNKTIMFGTLAVINRTTNNEQIGR